VSIPAARRVQRSGIQSAFVLPSGDLVELRAKSDVTHRTGKAGGAIISRRKPPCGNEAAKSRCSPGIESSGRIAQAPPRLILSETIGEAQRPHGGSLAVACATNAKFEAP
jgi:hypothetical protein